MKRLFLILLIVLFTQIATADEITHCFYNSNCPSGSVCSADVSGRGVCTNAVEAIDSMVVSGKLHQACSLPDDCDTGLLCYRPKGYLSNGTCEIDKKGERSE